MATGGVGLHPRRRRAPHRLDVGGAHPPLDYVYSDMQEYVERAVRLTDGSDLDRGDTFFPPGTHILLALPLWLFGVASPWPVGARRCCGPCCRASIPYLGWRVARWHFAPRGAAIAAGLLALWPLSILYGGYFLSETPATVCLLLVVWLSYEGADRSTSARARRWSPRRWGLSAGIAMAVRPQLGLNVVIAGAVLVARRPFRRPVTLAAMACLVVPVGATLALNAHAAGQPVGISENGGLNFFQGHCVVHAVDTRIPGAELNFISPVAAELGRGDDYFFRDHIAWEQGFFFGRGVGLHPGGRHRPCACVGHERRRPRLHDDAVADERRSLSAPPDRSQQCGLHDRATGGDRDHALRHRLGSAADRQVRS